MNLLHHPGAIQRLVGGTNVQAHDGPLRVKLNQSSSGVVGLNTAVLRPNPILMDPRRGHGFNLGRLGDRAQAEAAVDTVHDERPHTGIRLFDSQDLASGVRPNHGPRLLPEGEADNESRNALHTVLRVVQVLQVLDPSGHVWSACSASWSSWRPTPPSSEHGPQLGRTTAQVAGRTPLAGARPHGRPGAPAWEKEPGVRPPYPDQ